jgi:hypothetical protein
MDYAEVTSVIGEKHTFSEMLLLSGTQTVSRRFENKKSYSNLKDKTLFKG